MNCSRCNSQWPNPSCFVCCELPDDADDHPSKCQCHECQADRDAARGDYLRDEMIDRQMEEEYENR